MTAPLCARGIGFGRITVWRTGDASPLDEDDLALLEEIAARAAVAVDNARRYTKERRTAVGLQRSLLPPTTSQTPALEAASLYLPADADSGVGGDWFDVIPLSSARVALVVGDVAGHGLHATAMMGRLRSAVRAMADLELEPEELLAHVDDMVLQVAAEAESDDAEDGDAGTPLRSGPAGATCLYVVYDPVTRSCVMASAGHPPPAVVSPDGTVEYVELSPGPPLGVGGWPFEPVERDLPPGSVLALYTDGLIERGEGDIDQGMRDLADRLLRADVLGRPLRQARDDIVEGLPPGRLRDDVTLLLARTRVVDADSIATWQLDTDPAIVGDARHLVLDQLTAWDLDELAFSTELIVSELVTNAIRHMRRPGPAPADPGGHPDVRSLGLQQHAAQDAAREELRGRRSRPVHRRPALAPLGQPLHRGGQDRLVRTEPAPALTARPLATYNRAAVNETLDRLTKTSHSRGKNETGQRRYPLVMKLKVGWKYPHSS